MAYTQQEINAAYAAERAQGASDADLARVGAERFGVTAAQFAAAQQAYAPTPPAPPAAPQIPSPPPISSYNSPSPAPAPSGGGLLGQATTTATPGQAGSGGYQTSYGWDQSKLNAARDAAYAGGTDDGTAIQNYLNYARANQWGANETAAVFNRLTGHNLTGQQVQDYASGQGGALTGGGGLLGVQSDLAAAFHGKDDAQTNTYLQAAYEAAAKAGLGAGHVAGAAGALTGGTLDSAVANVDRWASINSLNLLRADADWAAEKGINDLKLINRDMHLNQMYAEDAAAQYGASSGEALNAIFQAQGLPPLPMREKPRPGAGLNYQPNLNREIDASRETIEGRLNNVLATDERGNYTNQVVRQAVDRAMQGFAGRGLLNSSMAQQAAQEAAIAKAIEIVGPDAERYFQQGRANQDAQNVFARDEQLNQYDVGKLGYQAQLDMGKMGYQSQLDMTKLTEQQRHDLEKLGLQNQYDSGERDKDRAWKTLEAEKDRLAAMQQAQIQASSRTADDQSWRFALAKMEQQSTMGNKQAGFVMDLVGKHQQNSMAIFNNTEMSPEAKVNMLNADVDYINKVADQYGQDVRLPTYSVAQVGGGAPTKGSSIRTTLGDSNPNSGHDGGE